MATGKAFINVTALGISNPTGALKVRTIKRRLPGEHDVVIAIRYCGVCHSDICAGRCEWPIPSFFPMVPGHEMVGIVERVGKSVSRFSVGDTVGVGTYVDSCRECAQCKSKAENWCTGKTKSFSETFQIPCEVGLWNTYNRCVGRELAISRGMPTELLYGGYSRMIVVDENYVLRITETDCLETLAPLLCAGITMYSPLKHFGALSRGSMFRVAVVGLGGLGSIAVRLSKAMGNKVFAISRSERKRKRFESELGVPFICSRDNEAMKSLNCTFDLVLSTIPVEYDVHPYLNLLKPEAAFCFVGLPPEGFKLRTFSPICKRRVHFCGSYLGGIEETQEMLDFCAKHSVACDVEVIDASQINSAWRSLLENSNRKERFVIDIGRTLVEGMEVKVPKTMPPSNIHPRAVAYGVGGESNL